MTDKTNLTQTQKSESTTSSTESGVNQSINHDKDRLKRQMQVRIFYTDYGIEQNRKYIEMAKKVIEALYFRDYRDETEFLTAISTQLKFDLTSVETNVEWYCTVATEFKHTGEAAEGTITFFAIGDLKFLLYKIKK